MTAGKPTEPKQPPSLCGISGKYINTRQAAAEIGLAEVTLKLWRQRGKGPPYTKLGDSAQARVMYPRAEFDAWLEARMIRPGGA